tara:strand:+ start:230 stop:715 length:486 start_codon:yes stop_codon:yes gene_type:complete
MNIIKNFLSDEESNNYIDFHKNVFNNNKPSCSLHRKTKVLDCTEFHHEPLIKLMYSKLLNLCNKIDKKLTINYFQIVEWPMNESQGEHVDFSYHPYTSIVYLNDDFEGGETVVDKKIYKPVKNSLISFEGNKLKHEVTKITKGIRYTIPCWYKYINNGKNS